MTYILILIICFGASVVGAICGIGGGIIIKPLLDACGIADVATISFLSGCTVLSMTAYSVAKSRLSKVGLQLKMSLPLIWGAVAGGVLGKWLFSIIQSMNKNSERVGAIQAFCLLLVTIGTLLYTIYKQKIPTYQVKSAVLSALIGLFLGLLSSFLGIGGGPINLVVFYFFFSMSTKVAAENSLYVIFFSQIAGLMQSLITGNVSEFSPVLLILMIVGGITGGVCGRSINKKISEQRVEGLFIGLMIVMILVNVYNLYRFW